MNRNFHHFLSIFFVFGIGLFLPQCQNSERNNAFRLGFSQCTMDDEWRVQMVKEMERETFLIQDVQLDILFKDAKSNIAKQRNDIRELVNSGVDVLMVSPLQSAPLKQLIDSVAELDIPIILIDRHINSEKRIYYIGANNYKIGQAAGQETLQLLPDGGNILCFTGLKGSKPAARRMDGFLSVVNDKPGFRVIPVECDWTEQTANSKMKDIIQKRKLIDLIFTHNDFMARGVIKAIQETGQLIPPIIGVDGLNAPGLGIDMVMNSLLTATFTYPSGGDVAIRTAYEILSKKDVALHQELSSVMIHQTNVRTIKIQRDEIDRQIEKIDQQNRILAHNKKEINQQQNKVKGITALLLILVVLFGFGLVLYFIRKRKQEQTDVDMGFQYTFPIPFVAGIKDDEKQFIGEVETVVLENLINQKLTIQFVADHFGMSHSTIYRKIKQITGLKGVELINLIRLQRAEKLLASTNMSIKEIAFQTGFSTSSYFSTSFLKQFGVSPAKFRKH